MAQRVVISLLVCLCVGVSAAAQQQTGTLKGKIEDQKGKPIAGAEVRAMSNRDRSVKETRTDESGNYSFELEPAEYVVSFDAEGYTGGTLREMQQVEAGKETNVKTIQLPKAKPTSLVRGAVFDASGYSLGGALVKLERIPTDEEAKEGKKIKSYKEEKITNSRGEFAFRLPSQRARYRVTASRRDYISQTKTVDVTESEAVPLAFTLEPSKKE
ncbi:MAG TPA: carboxypeptidase-like regulatory domain-containing protein [Blastocatellia bacterium]|nr:carboxypeptidase-like regulatory domain-containing protein [Blastocatellia bacterium]